jgi:hypothetical protein
MISEEEERVKSTILKNFSKCDKKNKQKEQSKLPGNVQFLPYKGKEKSPIKK